MTIVESAIAGTWWRQIPGGGDVLHRADHPADNRWQRGRVVDALYFADSPETAWAEWYRFLAEVGIPPDQALPRDLWRWSVDCASIVDLSTKEQLHNLGLAIPRPGRRHWAAFQDVGEQLWASGYAGLVAPSAARPENGQVLCLFRTEREVVGTRPLGPPTRHDRAPVVPTGMRT